METLPPTHCNRSRPERSFRAVLLTLRLPVMHVVPALAKAFALFVSVMLTSPVVLVPVQSAGSISVPQAPPRQVAGPAVVEHALCAVQVVPQVVTSFRFVSQLLLGSLSQSRSGPAHGKQTPFTQVSTSFWQATPVPQSPFWSQVSTALPLHCV